MNYMRRALSKNSKPSITVHRASAGKQFTGGKSSQSCASKVRHRLRRGYFRPRHTQRTSSPTLRSLAAWKMFCTECGTNLNEDAKFCTGCGAKTKAAQAAEPKLEIELCENCGAKLNEGAEFCTSCGTKKGESGEAPKDANDSKPLPPGSAPYADAPLGYIGEDGQWHVTIPHNMPKDEEGDFAFFTITPDRRYASVAIVQDPDVGPGDVVVLPLPPQIDETKLKFPPFKCLMPELDEEEIENGWDVFAPDGKTRVRLYPPVGVKMGEEFWVEVEKDGGCCDLSQEQQGCLCVACLCAVKISLSAVRAIFL